MNIFKILLISSTLVAFCACEVSTSGDGRSPSGFPYGYDQENATGGVDGGGGNAVVCRNQTGVIESAELLDLFEGSAMYGLNIQRSTNPFNTQVEKALEVIPPNSRQLIAAYANIVQRKMTILPPNTKLDKVDDSYEVVLPNQCQVEQLARFYSEERILINGDIWSFLSETDRAALILHEATYAANRLVGAADSRRSRHIVAHLFDPSTRWVDVKTNVPSDALTCIAMNERVLFTAFQSESKNWILNFEILGNSLVVSKKFAIVSTVTELDFNEAAIFPVSRGNDKIGQSMKLATSLISSFEGEDILLIEKIWEHPRSSDGQTFLEYQTPRYYLSWTSGSFPKDKSSKMILNCSVKINHP